MTASLDKIFLNSDAILTIKPQGEQMKMVNASKLNGPTVFQDLLEQKGLKYTYERRLIYDEVMRLKEHFDADSLYDRFKKKGLRISRDTVYRTIPFLLESGIIQKSVGDGKREFFERTSARGHHDHMVCVECGRIIEFKCEEIEKLQDRVCRENGFILKFHDHRLFGYCKVCGGTKTELS